MSHYFFYSFIGLLVYMSSLFLVSVITKKNSIADVGYGIGFIVVALISLFQNNALTYQIVMTLLVLQWGLRLALRIGSRNLNKPEDFRYAEYRKKWKFFYLRSYFQIFIFQGIIIYIISLPVILSDVYPKKANLAIFLIGLVLWIVGYIFEALGDYQLDTFLRLKHKPSKYMSKGLWSITRHPNYFGEATMWFGIFIISLSLSRYGIYTIISPILITFLLTKVSGIPMVEKRWKDDPEWKKYAAKTPAFIPRLTKK